MIQGETGDRRLEEERLQACRKKDRRMSPRGALHGLSDRIQVEGIGADILFMRPRYGAHLNTDAAGAFIAL